MKRNAIIMAAGFSSRFVPLSFEKPKGLLEVKGEILIERQIRQLKEAGIEEIVVVTGYKSECFAYLKEKHSVILIHNPYYKERNNHSSLYVARDYISNTYICSSDNYFSDNIFIQKPKNSYYSAVFNKGKTNEWCMAVDKTDRIVGVDIGGSDSFVMIGPAYINQDFSKKLKRLIVEAMGNEESKDFYWEDLYRHHMEEFEMYIRKYDDNVINEFDSLDDLRHFDSNYIKKTGSKVLEEIAIKHGCSESDINSIVPEKKEGFVEGFSYKIGKNRYRYFL